ISSKSNYNQFRNNVFFESEGSLVLRHGNYATINGNIFIGNDNSEFIGGIRVINTGHWITNNYFYKLKGSVFRAPLAVMNGIPKSPQNRYNQVTDVVVAYNSYINCGTPFHFSVGSNVSQSEVLPKSEIRSARPIRTVVANNLVYNESEMVLPVKAYDTIDGVAFYNNLLSSKNKSNYKLKGLSQADLKMKKISAYLFAPHKNEPTTYNGFDFETITTDLFGTPRNNGANTAGAIVVPVKEGSKLFDPSDYGPHWFLPPTTTKTPKTVVVGSKEEFIEALASAKARAVISLKAGTYQFSGPIVVNKDITLISEDKANKAQLVFSSKTTAFEMHPKGKLRLQSVTLKGDNNQHAFKTLDKNMAQAYGLFLENAELHKFKSVLEVSKGSFADTVSVVNSVIKDTARGFQLNKETNDKGDYNAAFVILKNTTFTNIAETVLDYYRGGYDESTIGGHLTFTNNTVAHSGSRSPDGILIKNRGIVNVQLSKNTFTNNPVKLVAVLWGEKGQKPVGNTLVNSGGIRVVQNLELKLMY
ncbi:MAG: chondroitinase-B domain-containing protein, partial [Marinirhabdus sp.]